MKSAVSPGSMKSAVDPLNFVHTSSSFQLILMMTFCIGLLLLISPWPPPPPGKPGRLQRRVFVSLQEVRSPSPLPPSIQDGEAGRKKEGNGGQEGGEGRNSWEECADFR
jgi:hypothetical protein